MNETMKTIFSRYSCRGFEDRAVSDEDLQIIARAAVASPSAMNVQPWKIVVVKNRELIREMDNEGMDILKKQDAAAYERFTARGGTLFYGAQAMIFVLTPKDSEDSWPAMDCGIVSQSIALAASSLGLGNVICGMAGIPLSGGRKKEFRERMRFPQGYSFGIAVLLGYPASKGEPHEPDLDKITYIS